MIRGENLRHFLSESSSKFQPKLTWRPALQFPALEGGNINIYNFLSSYSFSALFTLDLIGSFKYLVSQHSIEKRSYPKRIIMWYLSYCS